MQARSDPEAKRRYQMNVLTATSQTQGWRDNDFCWTVEGELVLLPPLECGRGSVDDGCGCRRSMSGMVSQRATTTIEVAHREELDPEIYFTIFSDCLMDLGYVPKRLMTEPDVVEWLREGTGVLMDLAEGFEVGTILERRGDSLNVRRVLGRMAS